MRKRAQDLKPVVRGYNGRKRGAGSKLKEVKSEESSKCRVQNVECRIQILLGGRGGTRPYHFQYGVVEVGDLRARARPTIFREACAGGRAGF